MNTDDQIRILIRAHQFPSVDDTLPRRPIATLFHTRVSVGPAGCRRSLDDGDEGFLDLLAELGGEAFTVVIDDGLVAEVQYGGEAFHLEHAEEVREEAGVVPPGDRFARGRFAFGGAVADRYVRDGRVGARGACSCPRGRRSRPRRGLVPR